MKNSKKGFTLVEMIAVIAIIAVCSAIILPAFSSMTSFANETADVSKASIIEHAVKATISDIINKKAFTNLDISNDISTITVRQALVLNDESVDLSTKQNGYEFCYNKKSDQIEAVKKGKESADQISFNEDTPLIELTPIKSN